MHTKESKKVPALRILVVDDDQNFRKLLTRHLHAISATISECTNGAEAVVEYLKNPFDLVIMDVDMPVMDGITATRKIKAADPSTTVLVQTSHQSKKLHKEAIEAGAFTIIDKAHLQTIPKIIEDLFSE